MEIRWFFYMVKHYIKYIIYIKNFILSFWVQKYQNFG